MPEKKVGSLISVHYHENKALLDLFSEIDSVLYYKDKPVASASNSDVLEQLSDSNGVLQYKGKPIAADLKVKDDPLNAIQVTDAKELFVNNSYFLNQQQYEMFSKFTYDASVLKFDSREVGLREDDVNLENAVKQVWEDIDSDTEYEWLKSENGSGNVDKIVLNDEQIDTIARRVINILGEKAPDYFPTPDEELFVPRPDGAEIYGYKKTMSVADPYARITYIEDNKDFIPAKMNFSTDAFNYGSWRKAFFMQIKPVMLNYDGTVAYELHPNNYYMKKDGTPSDVTDFDFPGNVMVGIPTIWFKRYTDDYGDEYIYVANMKVDDSYEAYAHTDEFGNILKYVYIPVYNGFLYNGRHLRSISDVIPSNNFNYASATSCAFRNNPEGLHMWNIEVRADEQMLADLLVLISKTCNIKAAFGNGNFNCPLIRTGTLNEKGLFYGANVNPTISGVKVFGIENYYGNLARWINGCYYHNNVMHVKMTYGTQDGSKYTGYNINDSYYVQIANSTPNIGINNNINIVRTFVNKYGRFVTQATGTSAAYYDCSSIEVADSSNYYRFQILNYKRDDYCSPFSSCYKHVSDVCNIWFGASLSCKPSVEENVLIPAAKI